ncbi:hypothetical protein [Enterococcus sp. AZ109]|uniref:hypothetical protein n=1 Tax=Enterococcus sp. AZ109 TaxID=2774634 RepID=UPI003F2802EE
MTQQPFTQYQLFHWKPATLEEQIMAYYQETQNSAITIQLLLAAKVRYQLGESNFEMFMQDFVRYLFTKVHITHEMRRYFFFFKEYFPEEEWKMVTARCFPPEHVTTNLMNVIQATTPGTHPRTLESS